MFISKESTTAQATSTHNQRPQRGRARRDLRRQLRGMSYSEGSAALSPQDSSQAERYQSHVGRYIQAVESYDGTAQGLSPIEEQMAILRWAFKADRAQGRYGSVDELADLEQARVLLTLHTDPARQDLGVVSTLEKDYLHPMRHEAFVHYQWMSRERQSPPKSKRRSTSTSTVDSNRDNVGKPPVPYILEDDGPGYAYEVTESDDSSAWGLSDLVPDRGGIEKKGIDRSAYAEAYQHWKEQHRKGTAPNKQAQRSTNYGLTWDRTGVDGFAAINKRFVSPPLLLPPPVPFVGVLAKAEVDASAKLGFGGNDGQAGARFALKTKVAGGVEGFAGLPFFAHAFGDLKFVAEASSDCLLSREGIADLSDVEVGVNLVGDLGIRVVGQTVATWNAVDAELLSYRFDIVDEALKLTFGLGKDAQAFAEWFGDALSTGRTVLGGGYELWQRAQEILAGADELLDQERKLHDLLEGAPRLPKLPPVDGMPLWNKELGKLKLRFPSLRAGESGVRILGLLTDFFGS